MGLKTNCYAKVWSCRANGKLYSGQISVSYKNKETGEYKNVFNGFVNFGGKAAEKLSQLGLPERVDKENPVYRSIQITESPDITNYYNPEYIKKLYGLAKGSEELTKFIQANASPNKVTIWDFEVSEGSSQKTAKANTKKKAPEPDEDDEDLPF